MTTSPQPESPEPLKVPEELLAIHQALEAGPTPGPWHSYTLGGQSPADFTLGGHLLELPKVYQDRSTALRPEDARYIASVNPAAMQAVLDYIAAIQAARNEAEAMRASSSEVALALAVASIQAAVLDYHYALDMRQHGGVAQDRAFNAICRALGLSWVQGEEAARRAATKGDAHA